ncbi:hypothetical protein QTP70_012089, partial [Hemibagrus guttatus]
MEDKAELRKSAFCGTNTLSPSSGHPAGWNYNTWQELLDVTALELRAGLAPGTPPEAEDYRQAEVHILKRVQQESFPEDYKLLRMESRFVARRGTPAELWSDRGTNFRGGERELREAYAALIPNLQRQLARQKIHFHFNPHRPLTLVEFGRGE